MQEQIYERVRAFAEKNRIFDACSLVVAGISGGGDSMAMLDLLQRMQKEYGYELRVVHVNHGIRGEEAERDQKLVEKICNDRGICFQAYVYDVPALSVQWKNGLEEAGRKVRKESFCKEMEKADGVDSGRKMIALAHNKNDLAETMLHHLCRGTGLRGLSPMKPRKDGIIRPVLCLERREIDEYLKERQIPCALDSTNLEDEYTRNRIRHHLIPVLESEINERAVSHMTETAELIGQAETYLSEQGKSLAEKARTKKKCFLFEDDFFKKEEILQKYAIREAIEQLAGHCRDLSMLHIKKVIDLYGSRTGTMISLPFAILAERTYEGIRLSVKKKETKKEKNEYRLPVPGEMECMYGKFETKIFAWSDQKICEKKYTKWLDYDKIKYDISVRTRREGDYLIVNSAGQRKKISRCMIDEKIPRELRDEIPLAAVENEILWLVGGRINERYKITSETKNVLEIKYQGGKSNE